MYMCIRYAYIIYINCMCVYLHFSAASVVGVYCDIGCYLLPTSLSHFEIKEVLVVFLKYMKKSICPVLGFPLVGIGTQGVTSTPRRNLGYGGCKGEMNQCTLY